MVAACPVSSRCRRHRLSVYAGVALLLLATAAAQTPAQRPVPARPDRVPKPDFTAQPTPADNTPTVAVIVITAVVGAALAIVLARRRARSAAAKPREAASSRVSGAPRQPCVFIAYRREDTADIAGRISDRLIQKFGRDAIFKDVDSIPLGQDFRQHLHDAVARCDALLAIVGPRWNEGAVAGRRRLDNPQDYLRIEVESALQRSIPVIPVLVHGATMPNEEDLPETLRPLAYRNAQPVRPDPDFTPDIERLIHGIESQFRRAPAAGA